MKYIKIAGIVWATIYFAVGAMKSFTLNSNDGWASVALLIALFLLPLPITIMAVWLPNLGGKALLGCVAINFIVVAAVIVDRHVFLVAYIGIFIIYIALCSIPHLLFAYGYLRAPRISNVTTTK